MFMIGIDPIRVRTSPRCSTSMRRSSKSCVSARIVRSVPRIAVAKDGALAFASVLDRILLGHVGSDIRGGMLGQCCRSAA